MGNAARFVVAGVVAVAAAARLPTSFTTSFTHVESASSQAVSEDPYDPSVDARLFDIHGLEDTHFVKPLLIEELSYGNDPEDIPSVDNDGTVESEHAWDATQNPASDHQRNSQPVPFDMLNHPESEPDSRRYSNNIEASRLHGAVRGLKISLLGTNETNTVGFASWWRLQEAVQAAELQKLRFLKRRPSGWDGHASMTARQTMVDEFKRLSTNQIQLLRSRAPTEPVKPQGPTIGPYDIPYGPGQPNGLFCSFSVPCQASQNNKDPNCVLVMDFAAGWEPGMILFGETPLYLDQLRGAVSVSSRPKVEVIHMVPADSNDPQEKWAEGEHLSTEATHWSYAITGPTADADLERQRRLKGERTFRVTITLHKLDIKDLGPTIVSLEVLEKCTGHLRILHANLPPQISISREEEARESADGTEPETLATERPVQEESGSSTRAAFSLFGVELPMLEDVMRRLGLGSGHKAKTALPSSAFVVRDFNLGGPRNMHNRFIDPASHLLPHTHYVPEASYLRLKANNYNMRVRCADYDTAESKAYDFLFYMKSGPEPYTVQMGSLIRHLPGQGRPYSNWPFAEIYHDEHMFVGYAIPAETPNRRITEEEAMKRYPRVSAVRCQINDFGSSDPVLELFDVYITGVGLPKIEIGRVTVNLDKNKSWERHAAYAKTERPEHREWLGHEWKGKTDLEPEVINEDTILSGGHPVSGSSKAEYPHDLDVWEGVATTTNKLESNKAHDLYKHTPDCTYEKGPALVVLEAASAMASSTGTFNCAVCLVNDVNEFYHEHQPPLDYQSAHPKIHRSVVFEWRVADVCMVLVGLYLVAHLTILVCEWVFGLVGATVANMLHGIGMFCGFVPHEGRISLEEDCEVVSHDFVMVERDAVEKEDGSTVMQAV